MKLKSWNNLITKNKKAYFDYEVINTYEAWLELRWYETKSVRNGHVNLRWAFIVSQNNELFVKWMHISVWKTLVNKSSVDTERQRKIFLYRKDINYLIWKSKEAGFSIIPLELYFVWSLIKLKVWLVKWRKVYEKKQILKERTMDKEAKLAMKKFLK
jgi:SsrA-binding protein